MDSIKLIADQIEDAGNTIDGVLEWLREDGASNSAIDELVKVMETCLGCAARLRVMDRQAC